MLNFQSFVEAEEILLCERVLNLFSAREKEPFASEVFEILNRSYAKIGGITGNGFRSPEDMIQNIPMWKLVRKNGEIVAAALYKDKNGRKGVAFGTNGTAEGKKAAKMLVKDSMTQNREWKEVSGAAWGFALKTLGMKEMKRKVIPIEKVKLLLPDDEIIPALGKDPEIRSDDPFREHYYMRKIGGEFHTKIAVGTPRISIS